MSDRGCIESLEDQLGDLRYRLRESKQAVGDADDAIELNKEKGGLSRPGGKSRHEVLLAEFNRTLAEHQRLQKEYEDLEEKIDRLKRASGVEPTRPAPPVRPPVVGRPAPSPAPMRETGGGSGGGIILAIILGVAAIWVFTGDEGPAPSRGSGAAVPTRPEPTGASRSRTPEQPRSNGDAVERMVDGALVAYGCGDNCHLTIRLGGEERTLLCGAPLCAEWDGDDGLPERYRGRLVSVRIESVDSDYGRMEAITEIQLK